nr:PREDICTED: sodium-independent sulfate anion transporter-like isoform X5 [Megachile rotundata]
MLFDRAQNLKSIAMKMFGFDRNLIVCIWFFTLCCKQTASECTQLTPCSCMFSNGEGYNLSPLQKLSPLQVTSENHTFYFHPCTNSPLSNVTNSECNLNKGVSLCVQQGNETHSLGTVEETSIEGGTNKVLPSLILRHGKNTTTIDLFCCDSCNSHLIRDPDVKNVARCDINRYAKRRLPILSWLTTYKLPWLPQDALAGFTVGLTAIPQVWPIRFLYGIVRVHCVRFLQEYHHRSYSHYGNNGATSGSRLWARHSGAANVFKGLHDRVARSFSPGWKDGDKRRRERERDKRQIPFPGTLGEGLPPFGPPPFSIIANNRTYDFIETTTAMGTTLFFVPVVSAIEHMAIAKAFAMGKSLDATQEMLALGLCNMFGSFVRSMPVTGSFTRTAVNHSSGVKTTFGGLFTGCLVLLASSLLTSTFRFIPKATLAAVIICAMYYMLDFKTYALLWRARKVDFFLMLITFLFCVFLKLEWGILIGIVLNLVILLYFSTRFTVQTEVEQTGDKALIRVTPEETIAFPAAEDFRARIMKLSENNSSNVVLDCKNLKRIDVTVAKNLKLLSNDLQLRGRAINCVNCRDNVEVVLKAIAPDTQSGPSGDQNLYH